MPGKGLTSIGLAAPPRRRWWSLEEEVSLDELLEVGGRRRFLDRLWCLEYFFERLALLRSTELLLESRCFVLPRRGEEALVAVAITSAASAGEVPSDGVLACGTGPTGGLVSETGPIRGTTVATFGSAGPSPTAVTTPDTAAESESIVKQQDSAGKGPTDTASQK